MVRLVKNDQGAAELIIHETVARVLLHRDFKGVLIIKTEDYDEVDC